MNRHPETFLTLSQSATEQRFNMPFAKTFDYDGDYVNDSHQKLIQTLHASGMIDLGIEGWLLPADALKLYELAYFCDGDVLELGAYRGLSATVINQACNDSKKQNVIISIDLDVEAVEKSRAELHSKSGGDRAHFFQDDAFSAVKNLAAIKRHFGFAFVDHSHQYEHVRDVCTELHRLIDLGGFALFHDFNDPRNADENEVHYGVYQGVLDGLKFDRWEFWGIYGCTGLFRRVGPW